MNSTRFILAFILTFTLSAAEPTWTHLKTENFEIYSTSGEKRSREAIQYFEQVRALFGKVFKAANNSKLPVRIIAFRNEKEFAPFRPGAAAAAYYSSGLERDYIVMQSVAPEYYPIAVHEYMHRIIHGMGLELPIWMNEGVAELFSTMKPIGNKVEMGRMDAQRAMVVRASKPIPLAAFMAVDRQSPLYNEKDKASIFYAQAFVLAHMLYFDPAYKGHIAALETALQQTKDPAKSILSTYGKTLDAVQTDLDNYMRQDRFYYGLVDITLDKAAESPEPLPVDDYESKILLAELYRVNSNYPESARLYEAAAKMSPDRPDAEEGLAWNAMYQHNQAEALPHFLRAIDLGSKKPLVFENAAKLNWKDSNRALGFMKRALELDPDIKDGNLTIGQLAMNAHAFQVALDALNKIKKVAPDQASNLFLAKAHALLGLNNFDEAHKNAELAKQYAKTDPERSNAEMLLTYFEKRDQQPPQTIVEMPDKRSREVRKSITGELVEVTCEGRQARLSIAGASGTKSQFLVPDPTRVEMRHIEGVTHEFTCGPQQNTRVTLGYIDPPTPAAGAGIVRSIEFVK